jgi:hypothetical protein
MRTLPLLLMPTSAISGSHCWGYWQALQTLNVNSVSLLRVRVSLEEREETVQEFRSKTFCSANHASVANFPRKVD